MRRFHSKKDDAPAGPPSLLLGPGLHPGHPDPGVLSLGRGLPLPIWPWNYPVSPPRLAPSDPVLWAESSSQAVSVCDNRLSTSSPRGPVPARLPLMFQGDDQNRGPHPMKVGGWDARRPHLPTSQQLVSTRNQLDLRLECPPTRLPRGEKSGIARHFTCSKSGPWFKRHLHSDGRPLLAGSLDSAPGVGFIWLICVGFPSAGLEFLPLESSGRCQTHVSGNPKSSGKFPNVIFS